MDPLAAAEFRGFNQNRRDCMVLVYRLATRGDGGKKVAEKRC
jgi:hypothetical protein